MKTAILYASSPHHHNTEKLVKTIAEKYPDVTLIETSKAKMIVLANYDLRRDGEVSRAEISNCCRSFQLQRL